VTSMNEVVIRPLRFSADITAMREFFEVLGLRARIESERGGWVDMVAGRGMVALHDSATSSTGGLPGQTVLSFEADDLDELQERLEAAGFEDVTVWDEAYGRVMSLKVAGETGSAIDERSTDLYGYKLHDARPDTRWSVTPRLDGVDQPAWQRFLTTLGGDNAELVSYGSPAAEFGVLLELGTTESLADVIQRLQAAGYEPTRTEDGFTVEDPDGQTVRVHG
jgi:hypothetical protein